MSIFALLIKQFLLTENLKLNYKQFPYIKNFAFMDISDEITLLTNSISGKAPSTA